MLAALGIAIGIATVVVVVGIPASSRQALDHQLSTLGTNLLRASATFDQVTEELPPVPEDAPAMAARIGPVEMTSAVANTHAQVRRSDRIPPEQSSGLTVLAARVTARGRPAPGSSARAWNTSQISRGPATADDVPVHQP